MAEPDVLAPRRRMMGPWAVPTGTIRSVFFSLFRIVFVVHAGEALVRHARVRAVTCPPSLRVPRDFDGALVHDVCAGVAVVVHDGGRELGGFRFAVPLHGDVAERDFSRRRVPAHATTHGAESETQHRFQQREESEPTRGN